MAASESEAKTKRRWLRFSLRSFLIVVTLLCIGLAWFVYRVERQKNAVRWVEENGGEVLYDYEYDSRAKLVHESKPPGPKWLRDIVGVHCFSSVHSVELEYDPVYPPITDITPLQTLKDLRRLELSNHEFSDLTPLRSLRRLEYLDLWNTEVTELSTLSGFTNLNTLYLNNVNDVTPLATLTKLKFLFISGTFSDVDPLAKLKNLEDLILHDTEVTDDDIQALQDALPNCSVQHN